MPMQAQRGGGGITPVVLNLGAGWVGQRHVSAALPPGKIRYPLYRRLGGPRGRSGRARKISTLPGFDPRTVQSEQVAIPTTLSWPDTIYSVQETVDFSVICY